MKLQTHISKGTLRRVIELYLPSQFFFWHFLGLFFSVYFDKPKEIMSIWNCYLTPDPKNYYLKKKSSQIRNLKNISRWYRNKATFKVRIFQEPQKFPLNNSASHLTVHDRSFWRQNGPEKRFAPTRSTTLLEATASHSLASTADGNVFRGAESPPNLSQGTATQ